MALTARLTASIYGKNGQSIGTTNGQTMNFPADLCYFYPAPASIGTYNGVVPKSVIVLLPTATKVQADQFYSVQTPAELVTAGT